MVFKVAVIGSGLAGLTSAYLLSKRPRDEFEVHIFEKRSTLGMDSSSITLPVPGEEREWRIDVPMRSFQGGYYPQVIALYKHLGISFREADFSYSFSILSSSAKGRSITAAMIYNGASGRGGVNMPSRMDISDKYPFLIRIAFKMWSIGLFTLLTVQVLVCYLRLLYLSFPFMRSQRLETMKFKDWAIETIPAGRLASWTMLDRAWKDFTQLILLPLFSAVCTASMVDVAEHPIEEFLDYVWLTFGTHHYIAVNGVRDVVSALVANISTRNVHLSSPITSIEVDPADSALVSVHCQSPDGPKVYSGFHHVILATEAPQAASLLSSYSSSLPAPLAPRQNFTQEQIRCLQQFNYTSTIVINHTDDTLLPDSTKDRRDLNLIYLDPLNPTVSKALHQDAVPRKVSPTHTMATQVLPRPKGFPAHLPQVFQTTNPIIEPREARILSVAKLDRAVMTVASKKALKDLHVEHRKRWWKGPGKLGRLQGRAPGDPKSPGVWICGSFAYPGIPLLEGCVVSARAVVEQGILRQAGIATRGLY